MHGEVPHSKHFRALKYNFLEHQFLPFEHPEKLRLRRRPSEAQVPVHNVKESEHGGEDYDAGVVHLGQPGLHKNHP